VKLVTPREQARRLLENETRLERLRGEIRTIRVDGETYKKLVRAADAEGVLVRELVVALVEGLSDVEPREKQKRPPGRPPREIEALDPATGETRTFKSQVEAERWLGRRFDLGRVLDKPKRSACGYRWRSVS
jgi:hypothetical protein